MGAGGIRAKAGAPLTVKLWTQNATQFKRVTEVVQAQLKAIGVNAEITAGRLHQRHVQEKDRSPVGSAQL